MPQTSTPARAILQWDKLSKYFRFYWGPRKLVRPWMVWKALVSFGNWSISLLVRLQPTNPIMLRDLWDSKTLSSFLYSFSSRVCGVFWVTPDFSTQQNSSRVTEIFCFINIRELFTFFVQCLMSSEKRTKTSLICFLSLPMSSAQEGHHFWSRPVSSIAPALNSGVVYLCFWGSSEVPIVQRAWSVISVHWMSFVCSCDHCSGKLWDPAEWDFASIPSHFC